MIVSTQLLEGDVCTIYSLLPESSEDLKDWEFSWAKKNGDTSTPFSFWLKNIVPERKRNSHIKASGLFSNSILSTRDKLDIVSGCQAVMADMVEGLVLERLL